MQSKVSYGCTSVYPAYVIVLIGSCPYICDLCIKIFAGVLLEAYRSACSGECPCRCDMCNEASSVQVQLKIHFHLCSD